MKRRNIIFERDLRKQEEGEPVDSFITDLYSLAEHCQYDTLYDEMIRDRLVVGLYDSKRSEKLQLDAKLTLDTALTTARQSEAVKKQQLIIRQETIIKEESIGAVSRGGKYKPEEEENSSNKPQHVFDVENHPCTTDYTAPQRKPFATSVGKEDISKVHADQYHPLVQFIKNHHEARKISSLATFRKIQMTPGMLMYN